MSGKRELMEALEAEVVRLRMVVEQIALQGQARQNTEPLSSVELATNAKGVVQIAVKVYSADPHQAAITAQQIYGQLKSSYERLADPPGSAELVARLKLEEEEVSHVLVAGA